MKIAVLVNAFPVTSETFIINQIVGLLRRGHEVDIHAFALPPERGAAHDEIARYALLDRVRQWQPMPSSWIARIPSAVMRIAGGGFRRPAIVLDSLNVFRHGRSALNLSRLHKRIPERRTGRRYDVIQCHYGPNGLRAFDLQSFGLLSGPVVTTFHGYDANRLPGIFGADMYDTLFARGDLFTVGSDFMKRRIVALGAPAERIVKLPMGVDLSKYRFAERNAAPSTAPRLLTVARLVEVKGIEYALRAVAMVKRRFPGVMYRIVGDGPLRRRLEELRRELGLQENVELLGALPSEAVMPLYEAADIFLLPSIVTASGEEENQPVVLAEAQALGVPVVASAIGGVAESMVDGGSGILVPPRDAEALARAIIALCEHPEERLRMAQRGRSHVEQEFDLERLNDRLAEIYAQLASSAPATA
jgi:colanic acid/amylovoran biosynthesis glycosyltransferase